MKRLFVTVFTAIVMLPAVNSRAADEPTPIIANVVAEPRVSEMSDGTFSVNYELQVTNATSASYTINDLSVAALNKTAEPIMTIDAAELFRHIRIPGEEKPSSVISAGKSGLIKINLVFPSKNDVPETIEHIITASAETPIPSIPQPVTEKIARTEILKNDPVVIGPPLRGSGWVAVAVGGHGYHRSTVMPINGIWVCAERWAVDWVQLAKDNRLLTGSFEKNESYPQYGREILAVGDGLITSLADGMPDITPGKSPENITIKEAAGNYIIQDLGGGFSALYAHLQPGSLKVKQGDAVKKGDVIALLGNSGNTTGPHLHFHVIKGNTPLGSDGVPYVIDKFAITGTAISEDSLETELTEGEVVKIAAGKGKTSVSMKMPADLSIVDF